jgi:hypothetical protein
MDRPGGREIEQEVRSVRSLELDPDELVIILPTQRRLSRRSHYLFSHSLPSYQL